MIAVAVVVALTGAPPCLGSQLRYHDKIGVTITTSASAMLLLLT